MRALGKIIGLIGVFRRKIVGEALLAIDALLVATAPQHSLTLVTRNTKDFIETGVELLNPWEGAV